MDATDKGFSMRRPHNRAMSAGLVCLPYMPVVLDIELALRHYITALRQLS